MAEKFTLTFEVNKANVARQCDNCRRGVAEGVAALQFTDVPALFYSALGDRRCWGSWECFQTTVNHNKPSYPDLAQWTQRHEAEIRPLLRPTCNPAPRA